jgi:hypothetical protein
MSDIQQKRDRLKSVLGRQIDRARENGQITFANLLYGMLIRTDAGRYDENLDAMILQHGQDVA